MKEEQELLIQQNKLWMQLGSSFLSQEKSVSEVRLQFFEGRLWSSKKAKTN
jgi:hypothetical protein